MQIESTAPLLYKFESVQYLDRDMLCLDTENDKSHSFDRLASLVK
jgi:hypothetical protein